MVKAYKLHKISGITAGIFLIVLSISGFFLDHDKWSFLYTTTFSSVPSHILTSQKRLFNGYYQDPKNPQHIITGGYRGLFESFDGGTKFSHISSLQILTIIPDKSTLYLATSDGIYTYHTNALKKIALSGKYITALSVSKDFIVAVVDKKTLITLQKANLKILSQKSVHIAKKLLQQDIKLSRFIRDLHYGRGLFDGELSLLINDYGAIVLTFLALSGYMIWWLIRSKKHPKLSRKLIKTHANIFAIIAIFPLLLLLITGVFLDHSSGLAKFMNALSVPHSALPPVYDSLENDIWSVDFDGNVYRIGNRYGIYKSKDCKNWIFENKGFAYKMIRRNNILYISGMGAPNRVYKNNQYKVLPNTPHMFKDIISENGKRKYFSTMQSDVKLPMLSSVTLYTLLLTLHDGSFFSAWWVWVNDFAAFTLLILCISGAIRWYVKAKFI